MSGFRIDTERLILRDWREEDVTPFARHTNTPAVMRWLGGVRDEADIQDLIRNRLPGWQREHGFTFWAVERRADNELLGFCGLKLTNEPGSRIEGEHEVGWRLREDAWGQGFAREAASAALDHAFGEVGAEQVFALTVPDNSASWGLMLRLGMTRRSSLDMESASWAAGPVIVYGITRDEWLKRGS